MIAVIVKALTEFINNHQCSPCQTYGYDVVASVTTVSCECNTDVFEARRALRTYSNQETLNQEALTLPRPLGEIDHEV